MNLHFCFILKKILNYRKVRFDEFYEKNDYFRKKNQFYD